MENLIALKLLQFFRNYRQQTNQENPHHRTFAFINQAETKDEKNFTKIYKYFSHMQKKVVVIRRETVQVW